MPHPDCYIDGWLGSGMLAGAEIGSDVHRSVPLHVPLPPRHPVTHRDRRSHHEPNPEFSTAPCGTQRPRPTGWPRTQNPPAAKRMTPPALTSIPAKRHPAQSFPLVILWTRNLRG
jgi:hypothetical protein